MAHVYHACIILHAMTDVHAAWHAARVRMDRAQDRSPPRARPGSGLLGGTEADLAGRCACTLSRMPQHSISSHHAAWHAAIRPCRRASLADRADSHNAASKRLTLSNAVAVELVSL